MICTGVNYCEYLASDIQAMEHTEVTVDMLEIIRERRRQNGVHTGARDANRFVMYYQCISNTLLIEFSFFLAERKRFIQRKACIDTRDSCTWVFVQEASEVKLLPDSYIRFIIHC